jgi:DNA-binding beta-propeller fold protein YncE
MAAVKGLGGDHTVAGVAAKLAAFSALTIAAAWLILPRNAAIGDWNASAAAAQRNSNGRPQLMSITPLPELAGDMCEWEPASASVSLTSQQARARQFSTRRLGELALTAAQVDDMSRRKHVRMIKDSFSAFSQIAVDVKNDEVVMTDESLFQILAYSRTENTPPKAAMSEPKRILGGLETSIEYQCGIYVDPGTGDIYAVNNDTVDKLVIFSRDKKGNVPPTRIINTPHTTYGIAVDEDRQELFLTAQESSSVVAYRKLAAADEAPLRMLQGDKTLLADPHGIAIDSQRKLLFISNFGNVSTKDKAHSSGEGFGVSNKANWPMARESAVPGTGRSTGASITVYALDANGDVPPMRVIKGPKTQMSWPTSMSLDPAKNDLYVANDTGDSILVFDAHAEGDAAPRRVIKGPKSKVKSPTGVYFDAVHNELWVANFGNHSASVYAANAAGDTPPLRVIRTAPPEAGVPNIGNAYAPAYDSKREQILVPN